MRSCRHYPRAGPRGGQQPGGYTVTSADLTAGRSGQIRVEISEPRGDGTRLAVANWPAVKGQHWGQAAHRPGDENLISAVQLGEAVVPDLYGNFRDGRRRKI